MCAFCEQSTGNEMKIWRNELCRRCVSNVNTVSRTIRQPHSCASPVNISRVGILPKHRLPRAGGPRGPYCQMPGSSEERPKAQTLNRMNTIYAAPEKDGHNMMCQTGVLGEFSDNLSGIRPVPQAADH